jgi:hypothetical protein
MKPVITINGKLIEGFTQNINGIFIPIESFEEASPINGVILHAYKCKYKDGYKWKIEYRKPIARFLKKEIHLRWVLTRDEAKKIINQIDQLL